MKTSSLLSYVPPVVVKPVCRGCKTMAPECLVPHGDGAIPMCWLCAHHVIEHGTAVDHAYVGECECLPSEIFPWHKCTGEDGTKTPCEGCKGVHKKRERAARRAS